jgi:hypothetical protein
MTNGAHTREGQLALPWHSSWLLGVPGAVVNDARDDSWRGSFVMWLLGEGVNVDGLAYPLHWPTVGSSQVRGHDLLPGAVLSCRCTEQWCLLGDVKPPGRRYLMET